MKLSNNGLKLIETFEGCELIPYPDANGFSVGYGHRLDPGASLEPITQGQAELYLESDVTWAEDCVNRLVTVSITQNQFDALVDFVYNLGCGALESSTLLKDLNEGDTRKAASQFLEWDHQNGIVVDGLLNRRMAEMKLFLTSDGA